jgi:hypothetical protein
VAHRPGRDLGIDAQAALRIGAVAAAALALVFWGRPTGKVVIGLAVALLVALAVIEFLGRPSHPIAEVSTSHTWTFAAPQ